MYRSWELRSRFDWGHSVDIRLLLRSKFGRAVPGSVRVSLLRSTTGDRSITGGSQAPATVVNTRVRGLARHVPQNAVECSEQDVINDK